MGLLERGDRGEGGERVDTGKRREGGGGGGERRDMREVSEEPHADIERQTDRRKSETNGKGPRKQQKQRWKMSNQTPRF